MRWTARLTLALALAAGLGVSAGPLRAQRLVPLPPGEQTPRLQGGVPLGAPSAAVAPDPCLDCDAIYAGDCGTGLWRIDPVAGTSVLVGQMPTNMFDIAITSDQRLFGITGGGEIYEISACDGSGIVVGSLGFVFVNGLAGDILSTDIFGQGPPLLRVVTSGTFPVTPIGGSIGSPPPLWCGISSGDLAMNPADGLFYSTLGCGGVCGGNTLVTVDPATGGVLSEVGCIRTSGGTAFGAVFGLAFDSSGVLWGGIGFFSSANLLRIDPATGVATLVPITGGYDCAFGLASCPQGLAPAVECDIKPGSDPNSINPRSRGVIPVAILGSSSFDVSDIDPASVRFGPDTAAAAHKVLIHFGDVDGDGFIDAVFHFRTQQTGIRQGDVEACISWMTFAGESFTCCDEIRTVPTQGHPGGGCSAAIGTPMPPGDIFGALLPYLVVAFGLLALHSRRGRLPVVQQGRWGNPAS